MVRTRFDSVANQRKSLLIAWHRPFPVTQPYLTKVDSMQRYSFCPAHVSSHPRRMHPGIVQRGFTLIEMMVVIAIIGVLAALIVPKIMSRPDEARRVAAKADIGSIMQSLNLYRLDNGRYPTQEQGLRALVEKPTTEPVPNNWKGGGYMDRVPA